MRERRQNKLADQFRDLIAKFLEIESDRKSVITVTRVELLGEAKLLRAYLSIFPADHEKTVLGFAERREGEARKYLAGKTVMRTVPKIEFVADQGEKNRQRIDELSRL